MISFGLLLLTNIFNFFVLHQYLLCFSRKRRIEGYFTLFALLFYSLSLTFINILRHPFLNLCWSFLIICLYSASFIFPCVYYIVLPFLFFGIGFIMEPLGFLFMRILDGYFPPGPFHVTYYVAIFLTEFFRFVIVFLIRSYWKNSLPKLPTRTTILLAGIPFATVVSCCLAIKMILDDESPTGNLLCIAIIFMVLFSNILVLSVLKKRSALLQKIHQNEMILQDAHLKESYYREIDKCNLQTRRIRHDLKNQLLGICAGEDENSPVSVRIQKILGELAKSDTCIYTANSILNSVLNIKFEEAKRQNIKVTCDILVPKYMNLDYGDTGVLFGNLLDNALDACVKLPPPHRFIHLSVNYANRTLTFKIVNSKSNQNEDDVHISKKESSNHGFGLTSVRNIVEKYNGITEFLDLGTAFESSAILYGIQSDKEIKPLTDK